MTGQIEATAKIMTPTEWISKELEIASRATNVLAEVAAETDNEATETPQWFVVDPDEGVSLARAASQFVGPFFSRKRAEEYLKRRRYDYGKDADVWCASAYYCDDYKRLYQASK